MEITESVSYTVVVNGTSYSFTNPHPISDLVVERTAAEQDIQLWTQRLADANARLTDIDSQIEALCTNPV